jgi:hypothetical protein
MKYPKPEHVINVVYRDLTGQYRYRASHAVLSKNHHKLVPVYIRHDGGTNLIFSKYIVPLELYQPFIDAVADVPLDKRVVYMPELNRAGQLAQSYLEGLQNTKTKEEEEGFKGQLYWAIGNYYQIVPNIKKIADMFMVGEHLVHSALRTRKLGIYAPEYTQPQKSPAQVRKEQEIAELKRDTRYAAIVRQVAKARSMYGTKSVSMHVSYLDCFPKYMGEPYIPKVCPVLKIELSYDVNAKNKPPNQVVIGRKSKRSEVNADSVLIMSYLARKLIEDTLTGMQKEKLLRELGCGAEWNKWKLAHE